jgi:histidinol phosphatase-like PHP family hydrolase
MSRDDTESRSQAAGAETARSRVTLAVLTDLHYGVPGALKARRSDIADILLQRAVHRLNRLIRPDITLILGDLLDAGSSPEAPEQLKRVRAILDGLTSPWIAIPGNHDGTPDDFYRVFDRPPDIVDIAGVRLLPFVDPEEPGYNARRLPPDIDRFRQARADYKGQIVALQHVCLAPPDRAEAPYNYTNAPAVIEAMTEAGVILSISGHHHAGAAPVRTETTTFITAPALCESPFALLTVTLEDGKVSVEQDQLAMPEQLGLVDMHVHTQLAYCSANMDVETAIALARDFGLAGLGFSEHSGQLHFTSHDYWNGVAAQVGMAGAREEHDRMPAYLDLKRRYGRGKVAFGLEVDGDYHGELMLRPENRGRVDHLLGSIHRTPSLYKPSLSLEILEAEFMSMLETLLANGIDILAHPFRIFSGVGYTPPQHLFGPVAALLYEHRVAAEINYHRNTPPPAFVRVCLDMGVKLAFGSDAHSLFEIGEFADHLRLLADLGFDGPLSDVLLPQREEGRI